jgi:hypothetical protein
MLKYIIPLLLISNVAYASIGEIATINGSGIVKRESDEIVGEQGVGLEMQDTIATANGRMQLEFEDDTRVDVTEHSRMVIDEFVYDPSSGNGALSMRATLGAVRYASGAIAKNSRQNVNIRTPSATIGVRGTDFMMIVDEIGGSMITLLPSCNTAGMCVVGEITVETDEGMVIMNQAFQTTVVSHSGMLPKPPVILELPENMLRSMLIVRRVTPYDEAAENAAPAVDLLDIDFLAFDELDKDPLVEGIKSIWVTDLDTNTYLNEVFVDAIDNQMKQLMAIFMDELDAQNTAFFEEKFLGLDPETGIFYDESPPNYIFRRSENSNMIDLILSQSYGYTLGVVQNGFNIHGYRIGVGNNTISINQQE